MSELNDGIFSINPIISVKRGGGGWTYTRSNPADLTPPTAEVLKETLDNSVVADITTTRGGAVVIRN